jgi:exodeoxyribonuclease VII large subunit
MTSTISPSNVKVLSVGELTRAVKGLIEEAYGQGVWVSGEVSNLRKHSSGHWYLTLKDAEARLSTVIYRGVNMRLKFDLRDGMEVIAKGRLSLYVPHGEYQLQVEELQPKGIGPLELAYRQLKEKLSRLNYFDPQRKKPLPRLPRRVALLASATGSAIRDLLETLAKRWPLTEVWVCPVRVQGEGAAREISTALRLLNRIGDPVRSEASAIDVIVIGRGGGSLEDLWAFNEEAVAQAIFVSRIPIVTGIGHEDDYTIADMVADVRGLTPTDAAVKVTPDQQEVLDWLLGLEEQLRRLLRRRLDLSREKLEALSKRRSMRLPLERLRDQERRLDDWSERLERSVRQRLLQSRQRLEAQIGQLETLSPLNVLARGYSLTRTETEQTVVRSPEQVRPGQRIVTHVQHGVIVSRVEDLERANA